MAGTLDIIIGIAIISVFMGLIAAFMVSKYNAALKLKNKIKDEWSNLVVEINYRFQLSTSYIQVVQTVVDVNLLNTLVALINRYNTLAAVQDIIDCYYQQEQLLMLSIKNNYFLSLVYFHYYFCRNYLSQLK